MHLKAAKKCQKKNNVHFSSLVAKNNSLVSNVCQISQVTVTIKVLKVFKYSTGQVSHILISSDLVQTVWKFQFLAFSKVRVWTLPL